MNKQFKRIVFTILLVTLLLMAPNRSAKADNSDVEEFVTRLYTLCLDRIPDQSGLDNWSSVLVDGLRTGTEVAHGFVFSTEFIAADYSDEEYVKMLYRVLMGREFDQGGLNTWVNMMQKNNYSREAVFNGFSQSVEFGEICDDYGITQGGPVGRVTDDISSFVMRFYQVFLGREADAGGLQTWTTVLKNKTMSASEVAAGFVFSDEFMNKDCDDATYISYLYIAFMDREADAGGVATWTDCLQNRGWTRRQVFEGFVGSDEFGDICRDYGISRDGIEELEEVTILPEGTKSFGLADGGTVVLEFDENGQMTSQCFFGTDGSLKEEYVFKRYSDSNYTYHYLRRKRDGYTTMYYLTNVDGAYFVKFEDGRRGASEYIDFVSENLDGTITIRYKKIEDRYKRYETYYENGLLSRAYTTKHNENGEEVLGEEVCYYSNGIMSCYDLYAYGSIVKSVSYEETGAVSFWSEYEYTENGILKKQASYRGEGTSMPTGISEYNEAGECIRREQWNWFDNILYTYYLYEYDRLVKCISYNEDGSVGSWDAYTYYADGSMKKEVQYYGEGTANCNFIREYDENGEYSREEFWSRNIDGICSQYQLLEYGKIITNIWYDETSGEVTYWFAYEYYDSGLKKRVVSYLGEGTSRLNYVEEYNENGNCVKKTIYSEGTVSYIQDYNEEGAILKSVHYNKNGRVLEWVSYEYHANGMEKRIVHYLGDGTSTPIGIDNYDEAGRHLGSLGEATPGIDEEQVYAVRSGDTSLLSERELQAYNKLISINEELGLDEMDSDIEIIKAVHDYLLLNTAYDEVHLENDAAGIAQSEECHYVEGTLLNGLAVCSGYASTFRLFMELHDIRCEYVWNTNHGWNVVELDGKWYHMDVTWDDPVPDVEGRVRYTYYLVTDEVLDYAGGHDNWQCECGGIHECDNEEFLDSPYGVDICTSEDEVKESIRKQLGNDTIILVCSTSTGPYLMELLECVYDELGGFYYYPTELLNVSYALKVKLNPGENTEGLTFYPGEV